MAHLMLREGVGLADGRVGVTSIDEVESPLWQTLPEDTVLAGHGTGSLSLEEHVRVAIRRMSCVESSASLLRRSQ
jgi:hypothetical protein